MPKSSGRVPSTGCAEMIGVEVGVGVGVVVGTAVGTILPLAELVGSEPAEADGVTKRIFSVLLGSSTPLLQAEKVSNAIANMQKEKNNSFFVLLKIFISFIRPISYCVCKPSLCINFIFILKNSKLFAINSFVSSF